MEVPAGAERGSGSFTLTPLENTIPETDATITITALHKGTTIRTTLLLQDDDQSTKRIADANVTLLPEVTRAIIASSVGAISERIQAFGSGASIHHSGIHGGISRFADRLQSDQPYRARIQPGWSSRLNNTFLAAGIKGRITIWGHANYRNLSGNQDQYSLDYDGSITGIHAGVDISFGKFLVGISASQFDGDLNYKHQGGTHQLSPTSPVQGQYHVNARTFTPYFTWSWNPRSRVWAMGSLGSGNVEISDPEAPPEETGTSLIAYAAGADLKLIPSQSGFSLVLKGAAWGGKMDLDQNTSRIRELDAHVYRIQISVEGSYRIPLADLGLLQPFVETGLRRDGGDGQTGAGLEMAGGARFSLPSAGLRIAGRGHVLVLHGGNMQEWGFGGQLSYTPGGHTGPAMELRSMTGDQFSSVQEIWRDTRWLNGKKHTRAATRVQSRLGYGFATRHGTVTPYAGMDFGQGIASQMGAEYRIGARLSIRMEATHQIRSSYETSPAVRALVILR